MISWSLGLEIAGLALASLDTFGIAQLVERLINKGAQKLYRFLTSISKESETPKITLWNAATSSFVLFAAGYFPMEFALNGAPESIGDLTFRALLVVASLLMLVPASAFLAWIPMRLITISPKGSVAGLGLFIAIAGLALELTA